MVPRVTLRRPAVLGLHQPARRLPQRPGTRPVTVGSVIGHGIIRDKARWTVAVPSCITAATEGRWPPATQDSEDAPGLLALGGIPLSVRKIWKWVLSRVRFVSAQVLGRVLHVLRAVIHAEGALKSRSEQIERAHAECDVLHVLPQGDLSPHGGAEPRKAHIEAVRQTFHAAVAEKGTGPAIDVWVHGFVYESFGGIDKDQPAEFVGKR